MGRQCGSPALLGGNLCRQHDPAAHRADNAAFAEARTLVAEQPVQDYQEAYERHLADIDQRTTPDAPAERAVESQEIDWPTTKPLSSRTGPYQGPDRRTKERSEG